MRDYVNCAECGMIINSDFAKSTSIKGNILFFCSERHLELYMKDEKL